MPDAVSFIRGHAGMGVLAPQYGPHRGCFLGRVEDVFGLHEVRQIVRRREQPG